MITNFGFGGGGTIDAYTKEESDARYLQHVHTINGQPIEGEGDLEIQTGDEHFKFNPEEAVEDGVVVYKDYSKDFKEGDVYPIDTVFYTETQYSGWSSGDTGQLYINVAPNEGLSSDIAITSKETVNGTPQYYIYIYTPGIKVELYKNGVLFNTYTGTYNFEVLDKRNVWSFKIVNDNEGKTFTVKRLYVKDGFYFRVYTKLGGAYYAKDGVNKELAIKEEVDNKLTTKLNTTDFNTYKSETDTDIDNLKSKVDGLELFKFPNATIFGQPIIQQGQISGFSAENYLQFPFVVDFKNRPFEIYMNITTGEHVSEQENILDSNYGLAFGVKNNHFVFTGSTNGTSWDLGENLGILYVRPYTTYDIKISYNGESYLVEFTFEGEEEWEQDITVASSSSLYPRTILIGKSVDNTHVFGGSINMNKCRLIISDEEVWQGMDDAGLAGRMAVNMNNIDSEGVEFINQLIDNKLNPISERLQNILGD